MNILKAYHQAWPVRGKFTISRGSRTQADVVVAELSDGAHVGRGECLPYPRYGESVEGVIEEIESLVAAVADGLDREGLQALLPAGAARNAVDLAFWDLECKRSGKRHWELAGLPAPGPVTTAYTLSIDSVENMGKKAAENATRPLLKLKLAGPEDLDRVAAVRENAPKSRIVVDANEAWTVEQYTALVPDLQRLGVEMVEQPLPAGEDAALAEIARPVPVCADESCHDLATLAGLEGRYDMINIKLDKTGGLTEALKVKQAATAAGYGIMIGCMLTSSLAVAPAVMLAQDVALADLDAPLLLAGDRDPPLRIEGSLVYPPEPLLWG